MPSDEFHVFDTTLRDGAQREGISYSVADKLAVARLLDELGVGFIEGGWPGAMPKDTEFFARAAAGELKLENAQLVAFGSTRKAGVKVADDQQVRALLDSQAPVCCIVAKSDVRHVKEALRTTNEENLSMVRDTVEFLVGEGRRVFLDCEHFFDGYKHDPDYGVLLLQTAFEAGASVGVLCDTNGGMLPLGIYETVSDVLARSGVRLGIHCQDDTACAVANSVSAVEAGVTHVQCTANGYGERTGNADLFATVANIQLKLGIAALPQENLREMKRISHALAEIANLAPNSHQAYVGVSAFAHKAGLHASALKVNPELYSHIDPTAVGNDTRILVTEMAGRASVELKGRELGVDIAADPAALARVVETVKTREAQGWTFEAADASFELLLRDELHEAGTRHFEVESWRTMVSPHAYGASGSEAIVKLVVDGQRLVAVGEGNGPVNALDMALRTALGQAYPQINDLELVDYKVRILPDSAGTGAVTRVLIQTRNHTGEWSTVGVDENVIVASWLALIDAMDYGLLRAGV
ncbi:MAG: citramalate synthase [Candidatus Nanopelagicales bacterium]